MLPSSSTLSLVSQINRLHWGQHWRRKSSVCSGFHFPKLRFFLFLYWLSISVSTISVSVCVGEFVCAHGYVCMRVCVCVCVLACVFVFVCVCDKDRYVMNSFTQSISHVNCHIKLFTIGNSFMPFSFCLNFSTKPLSIPFLLYSFLLIPHAHPSFLSYLFLVFSTISLYHSQFISPSFLYPL